MNERIPFNVPHIVGKELSYIQEAIYRGHLSGDGLFTERCSEWFETKLKTPKALLTHSCTAALEMSALLLNIAPGDEVILPSFTFVSTANAFVLRGAKPVFIDIRSDTLNLDETLIEGAVTERTRAIVPVHYAGVGCEMDPILSIAKKYGIAVIEDAAQGMLSTYKARPLGTIGEMGTLSFHETKNVVSGEGGALLLNRPEFFERAEILREKGTNRKQFSRGLVDKYRWVDLGSSFLPGEIVAAFLWAQLEEATVITARRLELWNRYQEAFAALEDDGLVRRPYIPQHCGHNAHMYYLILRSKEERNGALAYLKDLNIHAVFHYIPLHSSPAGRQFARTADLPNTESFSERLIRLPLWLGMGAKQERVIEAMGSYFRAS